MLTGKACIRRLPMQTAIPIGLPQIKSTFAGRWVSNAQAGWCINLQEVGNKSNMAIEEESKSSYR